MKLLMENWRKFVNEKADPGKLDPERFPTKLSSVAQNPKDAQLDTTKGATDQSREDDTIAVTPNFTAPVSQLKPSQSTMKISNAMGMALSMLLGKMPLGGNLGGFISSDNHIMDGHHRWVATAMVDPTKEVGGYLVDFPGSKLIPILNGITVGRLGITQGKEGSGSFDQFAEEPIRKTLAALMQSGSKFLSAEEVQAAVKKFTGKEGREGLELATRKFVDNISNLTFEVPAGAPERIDMPVIDNKRVKDADKIAAKALAQGEVDVNPPYGHEV